MVWTAPSQTSGDATCPHCGNPIWFGGGKLEIGNPVRRLAELGAKIEVDHQGQVTSVCLSGRKYDDTIIDRLIGMSTKPLIDIRNTAITDAGAKRLQQLLPNVTVLH